MLSSTRTYRVHHKCLSTKHNFQIDDGTDQILYIVRAAPLSVPSRLILCEASSDKDLIEIREEAHLHVAYDIEAINVDGSANQHLATVKRMHGDHHLHRTFEINSIYGVYQMERVGGHFGHEFRLTTGGQTVVDVIKSETSSFGDHTYEVQISHDEGGDRFLLAIAIAVWCGQRWHAI